MVLWIHECCFLFCVRSSVLLLHVWIICVQMWCVFDRFLSILWFCTIGCYFHRIGLYCKGKRVSNMEQADRDNIQRNIVQLSSLVDLEALYRELIQREVIDQVFIERIKARIWKKYIFCLKGWVINFLFFIMTCFAYLF